MAHLYSRRNSSEYRDKLTGEHKYGDLGQAIIACLFFALWISDSFLKYSAFLNQYISNSIRVPIGIILFILAGYLAITGLYIIFIKKRAESKVIKENVFRAVRHPVYLGEILLYLGFLMLSISLAALVIWIIGIGFLHYISRHEEKLLISRFGEDYRQYMREVPMWIPFIHRK